MLGPSCKRMLMLTAIEHSSMASGVAKYATTKIPLIAEKNMRPRSQIRKLKNCGHIVETWVDLCGNKREVHQFSNIVHFLNASTFYIFNINQKLSVFCELSRNQPNGIGFHLFTIIKTCTYL